MPVLLCAGANVDDLLYPAGIARFTLRGGCQTGPIARLHGRRMLSRRNKRPTLSATVYTLKGRSGKQLELRGFL